jgi:hypothetical protein
MNKHSQRGEGKLGFIISLLIAGIFLFLCFKIVPVRIDAYEFKDILKTEARLGSVRNTNAQVSKRIMSVAKEMNIPLDVKNLKVSRNQREVSISAKYEQQIDLKLMVYTYKFNVTETAPTW